MKIHAFSFMILTPHLCLFLPTSQLYDASLSSCASLNPCLFLVQTLHGWKQIINQQLYIPVPNVLELLSFGGIRLSLVLYHLIKIPLN